MGAPKNKSEDKIIELAGKQKKSHRAPAQNPENREQQLVSRAVDLAEKQLIEGTASSAVIVHYLKLASKREVLEREILEKQSQLMEAKAQSIVKDKDNEKLAKAAIEAMKSYNPSGN